MSKLSVITPRDGSDAAITSVLKSYTRRITATPPGTCPIAIQFSLLTASEIQTCGKCIPCRDGIPQLAELLQKVLDCRASQEDLEHIGQLARIVAEMSDCAIGYEAGKLVLEGLEIFADEYAHHINEHSCIAEIGQSIPCETMCPAHVNIPAYIALAQAEDYAGCINMIRKDNPFPTSCAFICENPCETKCRRQIIDAPVNIRGIKRFAVDQIAANKVATPPRAPESGRTVAVIGGGPSGMTCAYFLALMGHSVHVFEAREQLGGMMRYGIPAYRFPRNRLDEDLEAILSVGGIEVSCNVSVDAELMKKIVDEYDATYLSIGAHDSKTLDIQHTDAPGVMSAVQLLRAIGDGNYPDFSGKRVAVVGGGNVAMDCARTSVRAGAKEVSIVYRRRRDDMTALPAEIDSAIAEGVEMLTLQAPIGIEVDETGACCALLTQPQRIGPVKHGRPAPIDADKPQERLEADIILMAIGQSVDSEAFSAFGMQTNRGTFVANGHLEAVGYEGQGLFVGGDCQTGPATVIKAIGAGKVAARNIDEFLGFNHTLDCGVGVPDAHANDQTPRGRANITERPARERKYDFDCTENEMTHEEIMQECGRCLRCDQFGCGTLVAGRVQYV